MGMVGEACTPSNAYYPRTPDHTFYSGVHICWSYVYGFMSLNYGLGTMTTTAFISVFVRFLCSRRCCTDELETYIYNIEQISCVHHGRTKDEGCGQVKSI